MLRCSPFLDVGPLLVDHEFAPSLSHRGPILPLDQVNELGPAFGFRLPHGDDPEAMLRHDPGCMVLEPIMERIFVVIEYFVYAQLVDDILVLDASARNRRSQAQEDDCQCDRDGSDHCRNPAWWVLQRLLTTQTDS